MTDPHRRAVRGRVSLPEDAAGRAAGVRVVVEDVSRMDAPSTVVAEQRLRDVELHDAIPFELAIPTAEVDGSSRYSVRVHVDVSGSGEVSKGDYVSTASHPVLVQDQTQDDDVTVPVRRV